MNRRRALVVLGAAPAILSAPLLCAQQPGRIYRIGTLYAGKTPAPALAALVTADLAKLGWIEGKNIVLERRYAEDQIERLPALAADLVRLKVDVIYTVGTLAPLAAKRATSTIPIVMAAAGDPLGNGLVPSLARPGGNVTGNTIMAADIVGKRLQLLKEVLPSASRVAVFWNADNPYSRNAFKAAAPAAKALGVALQSHELRGLQDFKGTSESALRQRAEALIAIEDPLTHDLRAEITEFAARNHLPAVYGSHFFVEAGGLMSYGASFDDLRRRALAYIDKILRGAKPGDLPVEQPIVFELIVNRKAAERIGLALPHALLLRANQVVE